MKEKLYRSRIKKVFGGVAGGLADYLNLDPVLVRVLFIAATIFNGIGVLLYIILWIIIPEEPFDHSYQNYSKPSSQPETNPGNAEDVKFEDLSSGSTPIPPRSNKGRVTFGVILIVIGFVFLAENILPFFDFVDIFPLLFIIGGIYLIINSTRNRGRL